MAIVNFEDRFTSGFNEDALTTSTSGETIHNHGDLTTTGDLANGFFAGADDVGPQLWRHRDQRARRRRNLRAGRECACRKLRVGAHNGQLGVLSGGLTLFRRALAFSADGRRKRRAEAAAWSVS